MIHFIIKIPLNEVINDISRLFIKEPAGFTFSETEFYKLGTWGDPIFPNDLTDVLENNPTPETILKNIKGHYYYFFQEKRNSKIFIGNSLFSILPVYYSISKGFIYLSDKVLSFIKYIPVSINKRFILENILFNYPLFNISCFNEVLLLPANHALEIFNHKYNITEIVRIEDLFVKNPLSKRKSKKRVVDAFLKNAAIYYPGKTAMIALTGGFDGRTLVSTANWLEKPFKTFTFGTQDSDDLIIATKIAKKAGFVHENIKLNNDYILDESLHYGLKFIEGASGTASFTRAHYQFAINRLSTEGEIFITGNFGSEVFRAAHNAGEVISQNLYHLFSSTNYNEAISKIDKAAEWNWLNKGEFEESKHELYLDLKTLPSFDKKFQSFTLNQKFYKIVFDEILRKYFGAEMVNQFQTVKNRTPFLDYNFLKVLLASEYAGVYSDFFTHNPFKRFKGQVIYAYILNKTNSTLYRALTNKGYRPSDLLSMPGKFRILLSFIKKKLIKEHEAPRDPYGVSKAFENNKNYWNKMPVDELYFNKEKIQTQAERSIGLSIALSQAWWLNIIKQSVENK